MTPYMDGDEIQPSIQLSQSFLDDIALTQFPLSTITFNSYLQS